MVSNVECERVKSNPAIYMNMNNMNTNNQESLAEAMFGRKIRIPLERMKSKPRISLFKNKRTKQQFKKRHGTPP